MSAAATIGRPERVWSSRQEAIFQAVATLPPARHLVIEALAGTGKSTTIEECVWRTPPEASVLVCAFNKSIADSLRDRFDGEGAIEVCTLNSLGNRIVRSAMGQRVLTGTRERPDYVREGAKRLLGPGWAQRELRTAAAKIVSLAKGCLCPADPDELDALADEYGVELPEEPHRGRILGAAAELLRECREASGGPMNFDDQVWLPEVRDLAAPTWDFVFVDETQDLNAAQLALVQRVAGAEGRIVAVGDRRQAIYGFRGADREAIPRMIRELGAQTLPLDITYRCPASVVREANAYVPQLKARDGAPAGIVRDTTEDALRAQAQPGDMVLSRINAPLISLCYGWLAAGRRAVIQGREIGAGLVAWIEKAGCASVPQLERTVQEWCAKECARLAAAERDTQSTVDKADCIEALCEGCDSIEEVIAKCERLFGESSAGGEAILLSSTHRAKGLEAERVWLLRDTYLRWPGDEETNLLYVAITRSKHELIYVHKAPDAEDRS